MNVATQHFDSEIVQELRTVMGADFAHLLRTFATDSEMRIANIEQALAAADADALRRAAHSFKGSSGNMGARHLSELCKQIEDCAREGNVNECSSLIAQLLAEFGSVQRELKALLD